MPTPRRPVPVEGAVLSERTEGGRRRGGKGKGANGGGGDGGGGGVDSEKSLPSLMYGKRREALVRGDYLSLSTTTQKTLSRMVVPSLVAPFFDDSISRSTSKYAGQGRKNGEDGDGGAKKMESFFGEGGGVREGGGGGGGEGSGKRSSAFVRTQSASRRRDNRMSRYVYR